MPSLDALRKLIQSIQSAIAGREALVECATSTAQSGYSMRLGVKLMESDVVAYDNTVRDGSNRIIQFAYSRAVAAVGNPPGPNGTGVDPRCHATVEHSAPFTPGCERGCFHGGAFCNLHKKLEMWMQKKETPSDKIK